MIRILSDLHWGHKASLIKKSESLRRIISEADTVIFNGDTLEQKYEDSPLHVNRPLPSIDELRTQIENWNVNPIFITGNHDPSISEAHYCELNQGSILITHGDAIFDSIAPWSKHSGIMRDSVVRGLDRLTAQDSNSFYRYLQIFKDAALEEHALLMDYDPTVWGKIQIFARQAWPPTRIQKILQSWRDAPMKAVELVNRFTMSPKFLIIGHTHKPEITSQGRTTVINTGSFFPWPGATAVDIYSGGIVVRKIKNNGKQFIVGKELRRFRFEVDLTSLKIPIENHPQRVIKTETEVSA